MKRKTRGGGKWSTIDSMIMSQSWLQYDRLVKSFDGSSVMHYCKRIGCELMSP